MKTSLFPLEDFHDQKLFFRYLMNWQSNTPIDQLKQHTWVSQHIFIIDVFLPFMEKMGYKLQKIRNKKDAVDIDEVVSYQYEKEGEQLKSILTPILNSKE